MLGMDAHFPRTSQKMGWALHRILRHKIGPNAGSIPNAPFPTPNLPRGCEAAIPPRELDASPLGE